MRSRSQFIYLSSVLVELPKYWAQQMACIFTLIVLNKTHFIALGRMKETRLVRNFAHFDLLIVRASFAVASTMPYRIAFKIRHHAKNEHYDAPWNETRIEIMKHKSVRNKFAMKCLFDACWACPKKVETTQNEREILSRYCFVGFRVCRAPLIKFLDDRAVSAHWISLFCNSNKLMSSSNKLNVYTEKTADESKQSSEIVRPIAGNEATVKWFWIRAMFGLSSIGVLCVGN